MKNNLFWILAVVVLLAAACTFSTLGTPTSVANPPTATLPEVSQPTSTPVTHSLGTSIPATFTPAASEPLSMPTMAAQLTTNGPWLAFLRANGLNGDLVLMDANGMGETSYPFPMSSNDQILPPLLSNLLSSNGTWLAFYTGSAGPAFGQNGTTTGDLALNLMTQPTSGLPAGGTQVITRLLSSDYPANFDRAAKQLANPNITAQNLRDAFVAGITQAIAWSPDGVNLAFAGQMDGDSSDLYLYNARTQAITRLSSGPEEVQWIDWSPDGKWVLDGSCYQVGEGMTYDIFATSLDGKSSRQVLTDYQMAGNVTWINSHAFLTFQSANGPGNFGLERVDILTGKIDKVFTPSFYDFALDRLGDYLVVRPADGGMVLINLGNLAKTSITRSGLTYDYNYNPGFSSIGTGSQRRFILRDGTDSSLYFLSTSGVLTPVGVTADMYSISPDSQTWIAVKDNVQLFTAGSTTATTINLPEGVQQGGVQRIIWRPDSSGIFLVSASSQLYMLDFTSGASVLVEAVLSTTGPAGLIWVH